MALEHEILRKTWHQKLQVCFRLASDQIQKEAPAPILLDIPRHTYFPLVVENLRSYFAQYVKPELQKADIRVEYCGLPLHMHYPVGTSFDLFAYDIAPPWILTLRFEKYAGYEILYSSRAGAVRNYYFDTLKLADERKHNKCMVFRRLKTNDREQLWTGFVNNDFDKFWAINSKLMGKRSGKFFSYIPFRIYQLDKRYIEDLYSPVDPKNNKETTLKDLITKFTPEILPYQERMHILVQGFDIPVETKLQWLSEHFSYPDNFLHICIVPKT